MGVAEQPGSQIGRYRLLETIGEGGMGVVYRAEQAEPVRREVALKIIKPGMDSQRVLARFAAEEQALALMEHPHIARVYDAGVAPSGRPYFVMEHVQGLPITKYCDENRLTIEQRLHLFLHVCAAVQHAHQKGIIHRDLKPSNILVAVQDRQAIPKVIDFGVARAVGWALPTAAQGQAGPSTCLTEEGQLIGTPEYMSPEQANPANQDIDTRTDIYSLGVVLYELLAGVLPFDVEAFRTGGLDHIRQVICEEEPRSPSSRVRTPYREGILPLRVVGILPAIRERPRRGAPLGVGLDTKNKGGTPSPRRLYHRSTYEQLRGDLDRITLKALAKDRARRYATVDALATDIRHYLNHQPVSAAPPGTLYRAGKFARRHRQALAVAGGLVLLFAVLLWAVLAHVWAGRQSTYAEALEDRQILAEARKLFDSRGTQAQGTSDPASETLAVIEPLLASRHVGPQAQLLQATILVEYRYYDDAVPRLQKLLDQSPEIAGAAYALLARTIWEGPSLGPEEVKKAAEYQKKAEELLPKTAEAYYLRGMAALTIPEKLDLLAKALDLDSAHYPSRRLRALTYQASRKYELLKDEALLLRYSWPKDPLGYSLGATALKELGNHEGAVTFYDSAIDLMPKDDPQYVELNARRCDVLLAMGQYQRLMAEVPAGIKDAAPLQSRIFCALTALGKYEEAGVLFRRVLAAEPSTGPKFRDWYVGTELKDRAMKHVFDTLQAGRPWHPPDRKPEGRAFLAMFKAEETHRNLPAQARRLVTDGFTGRWSSDGTKVVFSLGIHGYSGVAVYDLKTHGTDLLIVPGKDPCWSPDGRYIAFVRDCKVLRLAEFAQTERRFQPRLNQDEEVWVMKADGTEPRRLASRAQWPSWSADGKFVYCHVRPRGQLCRIAVDDQQAQPVPMLRCPTGPVVVSPDGKHAAHMEGRSLQITDLDSRSCVAEWTTPLGVWPREWSDGGEVRLGEAGAGSERTGAWIYDFDRKEAAKILSGNITVATRSPDKTRLLFGLDTPFYEIWVADLDRGLPTVEAIGPAQTEEQHCRECLEAWSRELAVDPNAINRQRVRALFALWTGDGRAPLYLQEFERCLDRVSFPPFFCYTGAWTILREPPAVRDRLVPLTLLFTRKAAEKNPSYGRAIAPLLEAAGQRGEAVRLWRMAEADTNFFVNGGFEDGVQTPWHNIGDMTLAVVTELRGAAIPEKPIEGKYCLYVDVAPGAAEYWFDALVPINAVFQAGKKYTISAFLKAKKGTLDIWFKPEKNVSPWPTFGEQRKTITDTWAEYYVTTPVFTEDIIPANFVFLVGNATGGFWIDDVKFYEGDYVPTMVRK
jgi:serine/threonine protein kinase